MSETEGVSYRDRRRILVTIGGLLLLTGLTAAILGPLEMYCFTLFSEGGRFHYDGFGFGSFMFGNIACQIAGYYLIALVLVPLGYGHLRLRRWIRPLSLALLWSWAVLGIPLSLAFLFAWFSAKEPSVATAAVIAGAVAVAYPLIPALFIRFYRGRDVRLTLESRDPRKGWLERIPVPSLVVAVLFAFYVVALHALILFNGVFGVWGTWVTGLPGIVLIDVTSLFLIVTAWGTLAGRRWAWWSSLVIFGALSVSWVVTLAAGTWSDVLAATDFPPFEREILERIPLRGLQLAILVAIPLALTLVAILRARDPVPGPPAAQS